MDSRSNFVRTDTILKLQFVRCFDSQIDLRSSKSYHQSVTWFEANCKKGLSKSRLKRFCLKPEQEVYDRPDVNYGPVQNDPRCGLSSTNRNVAQRRIVGGNEAGFGSFPWQAYVRVGKIPSNSYFIPLSNSAFKIANKFFYLKRTQYIWKLFCGSFFNENSQMLKANTWLIPPKHWSWIFLDSDSLL